MNVKEIYLAGGCFWGTEKAFQLLNGVTDTEVGYANGTLDDPTYKDVCTDTTGHRETVKVVYDSDVLPLEKLMEVYFLCIDPTVKNRQGHDIGSQYQTGVYYTDENDREPLERIFEEEKKKYDAFYVELTELKCFWPAEEYHQDYLEKNPHGYCHIGNDTFEKVRNY